MERTDSDCDSEGPSPVVVNPQNAVEDLAPPQLDAIVKQGLERIGGVLVPSEIAHEKTSTAVKRKCHSCMRGGSIRSSRNSEGLLQVTMCEVHQHNSLTDCWIRCKGSVFDASAFMKEQEHPGGQRAFVRRAGGIVDCEEDYIFHSARGRKLWSRFRIAVIIDCDDPGEIESGGMCSIS